MSTITKGLLGFGVVAGVFGLAAFFGYTPFLKVVDNVMQVAGTTPQGGTTSTAHFYSIAALLAAPGANATSSSILNTTGNDLYVTSFKAGCELVGTSQTAYTGAGLAALTVKAATSSTVAPVSNSNLNLAGSITIATTTANFLESSTTAATGVSTVNYLWSAGSYMTFTTNATNTAQCTFGVDAFSS